MIAFFITSRVSRKVVATPVIFVPGLPALNLSTVSSFHVTPVYLTNLFTISSAVRSTGKLLSEVVVFILFVVFENDETVNNKIKATAFIRFNLILYLMKLCFL